mmetsp:Transcript_4259/g.6639  ORF Transcript_4259/g.6639 Transcript_4259/m.6639 type:complete len:98 (-) Transcript_4259:93-386(-)
MRTQLSSLIDPDLMVVRRTSPLKCHFPPSISPSVSKRFAKAWALASVEHNKAWRSFVSGINQQEYTSWDALTPYCNGRKHTKSTQRIWCNQMQVRST